MPESWSHRFVEKALCVGSESLCLKFFIKREHVISKMGGFLWLGKICTSTAKGALIGSGHSFCGMSGARPKGGCWVEQYGAAPL